MRASFFFLIILLFSCTTTPPTKKVAAIEECQKGAVVACFEQGLKSREAKDFKGARDYFKKGCELNHPFSCSEQGLMERMLGDMKNYEVLQDQACESMDAIACYNLACAYCIRNDQTKTMEALNKASSLGYHNYDAASKDPDLNCLQKNSAFKSWLTKIQKKSDQFFAISYDFSYLHGLDLSLRFPPSFVLTRSFPTLFTYKDSAQISVYLSPDPYPTCLSKLKDGTKAKEGVKDVKELNLVRNGLPAHIQRMSFTSERKNLNEILYATGNEKRCWVIDGISEAGIDQKLQDEIDMTVTSLVIKPFNQTKKEDYNLYLNSKEIKFAGVSTATQGAGLYSHYTANGKWVTPVQETSMYLGYFVSQKLEDETLFRQRLGDIALKLVPYGFEYSEFIESSTKIVDGKLAIYYKTRAIRNKSEVIVTSVFYQSSETKLPVLLVHFQPKGKKEILSWESALKSIVQK